MKVYYIFYKMKCLNFLQCNLYSIRNIIYLAAHYIPFGQYDQTFGDSFLLKICIFKCLAIMYYLKN